MIGRLAGGPFDGDEYELAGPVAPECLWCVACADPGSCEQRGVHWWLRPAPAEQDAKRQRERGGWGTGDVHRYRHAKVIGDVHVYVFADLSPAGFDRLAEHKPEPVTA